MEYQEYLSEKKELYDYFLCFLDEENQSENHFNELIQFIEKHKYQEKTYEFKSILHLINELSNNHYRTATFLPKIEQILSKYEEYLKESFPKDEIFDVFKKNPRILYFLFERNIITPDLIMNNLDFKEKEILVYRDYSQNDSTSILGYQYIINKKDPVSLNYKYYFFKSIHWEDEEKRSEIEKELLKKDENIFNNFEKKCQTGENSSYICQLIREDSVEEFITYTSRANIQLSSEIEESIFETHPFLIQNEMTLIEYAAFFGSKQIFNYLRMSGVELIPSLWLCAIHGNNSELISILEENHIKPSDESFNECLKESIKCHHNNIARYIEDNLLEESSFKNNSDSYGFHYYNYEFIPNSQSFQDYFNYACLYDHFAVVKILIEAKKVDINQIIILINILMMPKYIFHNRILNDISKIKYLIQFKII